MRHRKRILFVSHYSGLHGANVSLATMIQGLSARDWECVALFPGEGRATEHCRALGIPYVVRRSAYWMARERRGRWRRAVVNLGAVAGLRAVVRSGGFDVIYSNSSATPLGRLLQLATGLPHIWHIREFGAPDFDLHWDWGAKLFARGLRAADAIVCVSRAVAQYVVPAALPFQVIYDGVCSRSEAELRFGRRPPFAPKRALRFCFVGQMNPNKNQEQAILAFAQLGRDFPDAHLTFVGDHGNTYGDALVALVRELGLQERITFSGYRHPALDLIEDADALLMCSRWEALGRVTVEAMMLGKPVIGLRSSGTAEIIEHEVDGLLYDGTTEDLEACMRRLSREQEWAYSLGTSGYRKALARFTVERAAEQIERVLEEVLSDRAANP